jgi:hypothetical protein
MVSRLISALALIIKARVTFMKHYKSTGPRSIQGSCTRNLTRNHKISRTYINIAHTRKKHTVHLYYCLLRVRCARSNYQPRGLVPNKQANRQNSLQKPNSLLHLKYPISIQCPNTIPSHYVHDPCEYIYCTLLRFAPVLGTFLAQLRLLLTTRRFLNDSR